MRRLGTSLADEELAASPCTGVCRVEAVSGLCAGCLRTLDEIAAWGGLDVAGRLEVLQAVARRREVPGGKE